MVEYGDDDEKVGIRSKDKRVRKPAKDDSAQVTFNEREQFRIPRCGADRGLQSPDELEAKSG